MYFENSFAQEETSLHQQWKKLADLDNLTCKSDQLLFQKINGSPLCVLPSTYLKLVDRGYGNYDPSIMSKRPSMSNELMQSMVFNQTLMHHWHEMMQKNLTVMKRTSTNWVSQISSDADLLKNMLGPIASDPKLRLDMIDAMKDHSKMEIVMKQHSGWMDSVHHPVTNSETSYGLHHSACSWCPEYQNHSGHVSSSEFANPERMLDMMHVMWINSEMSQDMHSMMLQNPSHMRQMSEQVVIPMLDSIMDHEDLRQQMIDLLLEHQDFMNAIRHDGPETKH